MPQEEEDFSKQIEEQEAVLLELRQRQKSLQSLVLVDQPKGSNPKKQRRLVDWDGTLKRDVDLRAAALTASPAT